jgi:osmotically-inducible protein OsmY
VGVTAGGRRMSKFGLALSLAFVAAAPLAAGGCVVAVVGGVAGAGAAGYAAGQERGVGGTVDDIKTMTDIQVAMMNTEPPLPTNIDVTVYQGRVLLTGLVSSPQTKAEAGRIAQGVAGVRAVYDEIEVSPEKSGWDAAKDAWISAKLRSQLLFEADLRSFNYTVETVDGSVYLIGSARDQAELDRAVALARNIPDVRRVVSYVELRAGEPAVAQAAPTAGGAPVAAPPPAAAAPTEPVQAQHL